MTRERLLIALSLRREATMEADKGLWEAMQRLAAEYQLEDREPCAGLVLDPLYGPELEHATLQLRDDGLLWLGLKDGRTLVEPAPRSA